VQFSSVEELFRLLELPEQQRRSWEPHLIVHWHGDAPPQPAAAPLDLNNASADELEQLCWPEQRLQGLLRERRRGGFRDLADLQERLCLPASAIEALIGRVCFEARRAGPSLPLN
jgi:DNA uptake protein ComE-like DNA-binding protein